MKKWPWALPSAQWSVPTGLLTLSDSEASLSQGPCQVLPCQEGLSRGKLRRLNTSNQTED